MNFPPELLTPSQMAEADRLAGETISGIALMERAGAAVAEAAARLIPAGGRALVLCGPGNNGGDGWVAARVLREQGFHSTVATLVARDELTGDAAAAAGQWRGPAIPVKAADPDGFDLVVDALFGAGLARDLDGAARRLVERVEAWRKRSGRPVLAVDMPSGIDGASGAVRGAAVTASHTTTFFRLKPGHVLMPGRAACGIIECVDIGIPSRVLEAIAPDTHLNTPVLWGARYPLPTLAGHKYSRGHALVMSGPIAQTGAARLCARGALRAGAGLVTVATPTDALPVLAAGLTAIMTRVVDDADDLAALLADPRYNAVALGPGLGVGAGTRALVHAALAARDVATPPRSIVLDADALTSFADDPNRLFAAIAAGGHTVVMTPHDGEFSKLFGNLLDVHAAKPQRARRAAAISGATLLLKGPDTVVASPDGHAAIAMSDAPWLATAGSGDVLAGFVAGLLAQGMPAFDAAAAAVWLHAEAAMLHGPGLVSEDIPELLPRVLRRLIEAGALGPT